MEPKKPRHGDTAPHSDDARVFSDEQMALIREAFDAFDPQGTGHITVDRFCDVMRLLGQNPTTAEVEALKHEVDHDGSETVDFDEFVALMARKLRDADTEDEIVEAFRVFDKDGHGYIDVADLEGSLLNVAEEIGIDVLDVRSIVDYLDTTVGETHGSTRRVIYQRFIDVLRRKFVSAEDDAQAASHPI